MLFYEKLDLWYTDFGRSLPWRGIDDPYRIWLSEIILQQTRIEQGRDYYLRFVEAFPTVSALAAASDEQVMRLWQGLGYYSRCRNLVAAARYIADELGGQFPTTYDGILRLKGVGRYTAAAIASFAFRLPYPVIDGNVYRFISRLHGIATPVNTTAAYSEFEALLMRLIDRQRPDRFNAALMDFGSLQCRQQNPDCGSCPFAADCVAYRSGKVDLLPVRMPKRKPTDRYFHYVQLSWNMGDTRYTILRMRQGKDIWKGLYEFPLLELPTEVQHSEAEAHLAAFLADQFGLHTCTLRREAAYTHQLTHRTIKATFWVADLNEAPPRIASDFCVVDMREIKNIPVSRLIDKYLHRL